MECIIETGRLCLRLWDKADRLPFRRMNSDPRVMEFFPKPLSGEESDAFLEAIRQRISENGFGLWAVEEKATSSWIGFIGFNRPKFEADFTPCVEIGWRLLPGAWGKGYATEGALACLDYGFHPLGFEEVVSFTSLLNARSQKVMARLGMKPDHEFMHPLIEAHQPLAPHILYRIKRADFLNPLQDGSPAII